MMENLILRKGNQSDRAAIDELLLRNDMGAGHPPTEYIVAEIDDQIVGAAHLVWEDEAAYVHQLAVDSAWQGRNIGKYLIQQITQDVPSLHVISRGEVAGFYRKLGFQIMTWDQVPEKLCQECETCSILETCSPVPMVLSVKL